MPDRRAFLGAVGGGFTLAAVPALATAPSARALDALRRFGLVDRMRRLAIPAVSVAVVDGGTIVAAYAFGVTTPRGVNRVTPHTRFQAASMSKPVASYGMLAMLARRITTLDDPVNHHLRSWQLPASRFGDPGLVSVRRLMSHTAGLSVHGFNGYAIGQRLPTLPQILDGVRPANNPPVRIVRPPGAAMVYSGGGIVLMQQLMEDLGGRPFDAYMSRTVFGPLGMHESSFAQPPPLLHAPLLAYGTLSNGTEVGGGFRVHPEQAPAGLWTTPSDLARFAIGLQRGYNGTGRLTHDALVRAMLNPGLGGWGLGIGVSRVGAARRFWHNGANAGYRGLLVGYTSGQAAVVMTNSDNGDQITQPIVRAIANAFSWPGESS